MGLLLAAPLPLQAGHDQDEEDLTYFLPIAPDRTKQLIEGGEKIFFVDLREPDDFKRSRLPGAVSIPLKELPAQMIRVPRAGRVVLYCSCGPGNIEEGYSWDPLESTCRHASLSIL